MPPETQPTLVELPRAGWAEYLDLLSADYAGGVASVHAQGRGENGGGAKAMCRPLRTIRYDDGRRELELAVGSDTLVRPMRCFIAEPVRILAGASTAGHAVLVIDGDGTHTSIVVRRTTDQAELRPSLSRA